MEGCTCGGKQGFTQFAASHILYCEGCHRLSVSPLVDPRIPSFRDHMKCLNEEIAVEEEDVDESKVLKVVVESASPSPEGVKLDVQIMGGDPRWVVKGSRLEAFPSDQKKKDESSNVRVEQKAGEVLHLYSDNPSWRDLARGFQLTLQPQSNATLYRNLLKAFAVTAKHDPDAGGLLKPQSLPPIGKDLPTLDPKHLRPKQAEAVQKALALQQDGVLLIQGPPGTGKTTVIARFISEAVRRGETVLVTSHTHVAIDNALRKAIKGDRRLANRVVRLGESRAVSIDLVPFNKPIGKFHMDPEEDDAKPLFESVYQDYPVVGMTLDALACALVYADSLDQTIQRFDHVIVDEAGMNAYPKLAIARHVGKRLLLVGDPLQLPPIIRAWSYRNDEHYRRSHFEVLQLFRPDLSIMLDEQFRCAPDIYQWSIDAVYGGHVASRRGKGSHPEKLLGTKLEGDVVWIDTAQVKGNRAERVGTSRVNPTHRELALQACVELIKQDVHPADIGYIAPFKAQSEAFKEAAEQHRHRAALSQITASTVDAFQGNERKVILYDLTSLRPGKPHEDHRRLNVSLTRAEELLVIIGPRTFVRRAKDNPFYWSLQNWHAAQVLEPNQKVAA